MPIAGARVFWKLAYIVLVAALVGRLMVRAGSSLGAANDAAVAPTQVRPGDELSQVALGRGPSRWSVTLLGFGSRGTSIPKLFSGQCGIVVFFETDCNVSRRIAERWRGMRSLAVSRDVVPVVWVSTRNDDKGADAFRREFDLGGEGTFVRSRRDLATLGVGFVPIAYLVDRQARLVQSFQTPDQITRLPSGCGARAS